MTFPRTASGFLMMKSVDSTPRRDIHVVLNWAAELERLVPTEN